ncbi:MAG: hypothetical protein LBS46_04835 [Dysgonamonadaceae bacterium]|nr:hypothetical protein [Dysgonamonadaceae bacterium]
MKRDYVHALLVVMLGITLGFSSCEKEAEPVAPGKGIPAEFSVSCAPFGADATLSRSAGARNRVLEEVEIPLDDNWMLSASLEEEALAPIRADYDAITDGAKFRVVAYEKSGASYINPTSAEYTYSSLSGQLTSTSPLILVVGTTYKYVYYTYNSTSILPAYSASITVTPNPGAALNNDLLWGESTDIQAGNPISVSLAHKFTRIRLKVMTDQSADYGLQKVIASFLTNHSGTLTVADGSFSSPVSITGQPLAGGTLPTTATAVDISSTAFVVSDYSLVHTANQSSVTVQIGGQIGNASFSNLMPSFTGPLSPGYSYVLRVTLRQGVPFAGSNIFWVEDPVDATTGYLTFHPHGYNGPDTCNLGVFFKWGSLIGVSPALTPTAPIAPENFSGGDDTNLSTGTPIYVYDAAESKWIKTNGATASNASIGGVLFGAANGEYDQTAWDRIPWCNDLYAVNGIDLNYLHDYLTDDPSTGIGDICRFLGVKGYAPVGYRMPVCWQEFDDINPSGNVSYTWDATGLIGISRYRRIPATGAYLSITNQNDAGTTKMPDCGVRLDGAYFPAAGYRSNLIGWVDSYVGRSVLYWSGSSSNSVEAYSMTNTMHQCVPANPGVDKSDGMSVRCVKD